MDAIRITFFKVHAMLQACKTDEATARVWHRSQAELAGCPET